MIYEATVLVNVDRNCFFGYEEGQPLACDERTKFVVEAETQRDAAEAMFPIGNREGRDLYGKTLSGDIRSLSVGDVVQVSATEVQQRYFPVQDVPATKFFACESTGWVEVDVPTNVIDDFTWPHGDTDAEVTV